MLLPSQLRVQLRAGSWPYYVHDCQSGSAIAKGPTWQLNLQHNLEELVYSVADVSGSAGSCCMFSWLYSRGGICTSAGWHHAGSTSLIPGQHMQYPVAGAVQQADPANCARNACSIAIAAIT